MAATRDDRPQRPQVSSAVRGVNEITGSDWTVLLSDQPMPRDVIGQYVYHAEDRELLLSIGRQEIESHGFHEGRLSRRASAQGYVLCLYSAEDSRKSELVQRVVARGGVLRYIYWRADTLVPRIDTPPSATWPSGDVGTE